MALLQALVRRRGSALLQSASRGWRGKRYRHTDPQAACDAQLLDDCFELRYGGRVMQFSYVWLRDHCRSASCYDPKMNQRILDTASIGRGIRPAETRVDRENLILTWPGGHVTCYNLAWLARKSYEGRNWKAVQPRVLWNAAIYSDAKPPSAGWEKFLSCDEELKTFLQNLLVYGVAFVEGVPATADATETLSKRLGVIRETLFGRFWSFTSDHSRADSAYTDQALDRHTDTPYLQEPCGMQIFHCLRHEGTGGRLLLVDGFNSANKVLEQSPEDFELLSRVPLKHKFIENIGTERNHLICMAPILSVQPWNNEVYMMRYNNNHREVMNTVPHGVVQRWYEAHRRLTAELRKPENELRVKLEPGKVLVVDNWRVLHGRESFTGLRQIYGCYVTRDDVLSKARLLGLPV